MNNLLEKYKNIKKGDIIEFGLYPQSIISPNVYIEKKESDSTYYIGSDKEKYVVVKTEAFDDKNQKFSNGTKIEKGEEYFFRLEPIKWEVLETKGDEILLFSTLILDGHKFDKRSNIYKDSEIKKWLENDLYNMAFTDEEKRMIKETLVKDQDNVLNNIFSNIFLLSESEIKNTSYGFKKGICDDNRCKMATDYAKAKKVLADKKTQTSVYWLRSIGDFLFGGVGCVAEKGRIESGILGIDYGVAPAIWVDLKKN